MHKQVCQESIQKKGEKAKNIQEDGFLCWKRACFCSTLALRAAYSFGNCSSKKLLNSKHTFGQSLGCGHSQTLQMIMSSSGTIIQASQYTGHRNSKHMHINRRKNNECRKNIACARMHTRRVDI